MKKIFTLAFLILTLSLYTSSVNAQCSYTLELYDSYGDGWNGNTIDVDTNGVAYGNYTAVGFGSTFILTGLSTGMTITLTWNATGSWQSENSWELLGASGVSVHIEGAAGIPTTTPLTFIVNCPPCSPPSSLNATAITGSSATLSWVPGATVFNDMEIGLAGFTPGTGTSFYSTSGVNTSENVTGLSSATAYDFYVSGICPNGDSVLFMGPYSFTTTFLIPDGVACVTGASSILFSEDFETTAVSGTPLAWTGAFGTFQAWEVTPANANSFNTGPNVNASGTQHLEFQAGTNYSASVISPAINLTTANDEVELSFYMHAFGTGFGTFNVNVSTSPSGPFTSVFSYSGDYQASATQAWEHVAVDLTAYVGQVIYIQLSNNSNSFSGDMAIDLIEVRSCVTCPAPTALTAANITGSTVDLSWTTGGAGVWLVEYGPTGFVPGSGDSTIVSIASSLTVTGLNPATTYDWYVADFCGVGDTSNFVGPNSFTTPFLIPDGVACVTGASSILFSEDFEGALHSTPAGWTGNFSGSATQWDVTTANTNSFGTGPNIAVSGSQHMEFEGSGASTSGGMATALSPPINLTSANDEVELSFWMHAFGDDMGTFTINVSNSTTGPFTQIFTYSGDFQTTATDPWVHIAADLTPYLGQIIYLQFTNQVTSTYECDVSIDDIEVVSCVTCPAPTALTAANITSSTVDLSWTTGGAGVWLVEYGPTGFVPGSGDSTIVSIATSLTVTGLNPATSYDFYVHDFCGVGDTSVGVSISNLTTDFLTPNGVACITGGSSVIFSEDFEGPISGTPSGWIGNFGTAAGSWEVTPPNTNSFNTGPNIAVSNARHLEFQAGNNSTGTAVSPPINLTTSNDEVELAFWLHAFGTGMGTFNINISTSQSGPFTPIFTYSGNLQTTATQAWEHIAVDLTPYIGQIVYLQLQNSSVSFLGDVAIDMIEVTSCLTCPAPTDVVTSSVTGTSADVAWTTGGSLVWVVEYGPAGFAPGNGDTLFTTPTNPVSLTGLNSSTVYDVFVYDLCGVGDTSFAAGPGRFATECDTVNAPYYQTFDFSLTDPHCWMSAGVDPWRYTVSGSTAFPSPQNGVSGSVDHTSGTGNFAWVDASGFPGINPNELISPVIDYSSLTQGIVGFWVKSFNNTNNNTAQNQIQLEGYNGATWDSITNYSGNFDGWRRVYSNIPATLPLITQFRLVQINDPIQNSTWANDILVDDFFVEEAPTCFNPSNLVHTVLSPTSVELAWTTGGASDWIIEYGLSGFLPGTGAGNLISTNSNPYTLNLNSGEDYDWYVQDSCGPTDISWHSYVDMIRMPGEVQCDSVSTNFVYCHPDESIENYTYQSDNSSSLLHIVFNSGTIANFVDFWIYDGPDDTYPILFSSTGNTNMTGMVFVTSSSVVTFSYNSVFANVCNIPLDFDINCCDPTTFTSYDKVCVGDSLTLPDGLVVHDEGAYYSTIENVLGCDSVVTTIFTFIEDTVNVSDVICSGSIYTLPDGSTASGPGYYPTLLMNSLGCDSFVNVTLFQGMPTASSMNASICQGSSYIMPDGSTVSTPGLHTAVLVNSVGCDSTIAVNLTVNNATTETQDVTICQGQTHQLPDGIVQSTAGVYTSIGTNFFGCTHTVTTNLSVSSPSFYTDSVELCGNQTYTLVSGNQVSSAGEYNVNINNAAGCDSLITIFISKCNAIGDLDKDNILSIFPNPAMDYVNIEFNKSLLYNVDFAIVNTLGKEVYSLDVIKNDKLRVNTSKFANGLYFIVIRDSESKSVHKLMISK